MSSSARGDCCKSGARPRKHAKSSQGTADSIKGCFWCHTGAGPSGKLQKCGRCGTVAYCTVECQKAHWSIHKLRCMKPSAMRPKGLPGCIHAECEDDLELYRQSIVPELLIAYRSAYSLGKPDFSYHTSLISIPLLYDSSRTAKTDRQRFLPNGPITLVSHADALALHLLNPREFENLALGAKISFGPNKPPVVLPPNLIMVAVLYRITDAEDRFDEMSKLGLATVELDGCYTPFLPLKERTLNPNWAKNLEDGLRKKEVPRFGILARDDLMESEGDAGLLQFLRAGSRPPG
ncbi:hypothetical protein RQP46_008995 [Phenoliferia psychrophenolica]